jgi:hypothetical protein
LLILAHRRRKILWLGVTAHPSAEWIAGQLTEAFGWEHDEQAKTDFMKDPDAGIAKAETYYSEHSG